MLELLLTYFHINLRVVRLSLRYLDPLARVLRSMLAEYDLSDGLACRHHPNKSCLRWPAKGGILVSASRKVESCCGRSLLGWLAGRAGLAPACV